MYDMLNNHEELFAEVANPIKPGNLSLNAVYLLFWKCKAILSRTRVCGKISNTSRIESTNVAQKMRNCLSINRNFNTGVAGHM